MGRGFISLRVQRGVTLVVGLVMLALITIISLMAFNMSQGNLKIVSNAQVREEAQRSAQQAIDVVVNTDFSKNKNSPVPSGGSCSGSQYCADLNGNGENDYIVNVQAECMRVRPIYTNELNLKNPEDLFCTVQDTPQVNPVPAGQSLCADTVWEIRATAKDVQLSNATVSAEVTQGVAVRISIDAADSACK